MKNRVTLYNMIFPFWMLWIWPAFWLIALPANFAIDLAVLAISLRCLRIGERKKKIKSAILKVWLCGFLADFAGTAGMLFAAIYDYDRNSRFGNWWYENMTNAVALNPFENIYSFLWVTVCTAVSAVLIYFLNYCFCLKKLEIDSSQRKRISLALAVITAPWLFYLPTGVFY